MSDRIPFAMLAEMMEQARERIVAVRLSQRTWDRVLAAIGPAIPDERYPGMSLQGLEVLIDDAVPYGAHVVMTHEQAADWKAERDRRKRWRAMPYLGPIPGESIEDACKRVGVKWRDE